MGGAYGQKAAMVADLSVLRHSARIVHWAHRGHRPPDPEAQARIEAERAEQRRQAEAQRQAAEVEAQRVAAAAAARRTDLQCWGDEHISEANIACYPLVQRLARLDYRWTDGFLGSRFDRFQWEYEEAGTLRYWGDHVEFQNGFGNWIRHQYWCIYEPHNDRARVAHAEPGRLK